jgi:hypothetical protein
MRNFKTHASGYDVFLALPDPITLPCNLQNLLQRQSRYSNKPLSLSQCIHDVQLNGAKGGKDASKKTHQHRKDDALQENSRAEAK